MKKYVTELTTLEERKKIRVQLDHRFALVAIFEHQPYAILDKCPHMGAMLSTGKYENGVIVCKDHALSVSVVDGLVTDHVKADFLKMESYARDVRTFRCEVENGKVYINY